MTACYLAIEGCSLAIKGRCNLCYFLFRSQCHPFIRARANTSLIQSRRSCFERSSSAYITDIFRAVRLCVLSIDRIGLDHTSEMLSAALVKRRNPTTCLGCRKRKTRCIRDGQGTCARCDVNQCACVLPKTKRALLEVGKVFLITHGSLSN